MLYAISDSGERYPLTAVKDSDRIIYTLKKETFENAASVTVTADEFSAGAGEDGFYIIPRNISILGDTLIKFNERPDTEYFCRTPIMCAASVKTDKFCGLVRFERNYRAGFITRVTDNKYSFGVLYEFTDRPKEAYDKPYDDIRIELVPLPDAKTAGDFAKAERELRLTRGEITTLREKCEREVVDYSRKHPVIRIRMGWKQSPSPYTHQHVGNEPMMHTAVTFARVRDIADALKKEGVEGADLQLVGWNKSGHDGRFPQLFPVEEALGGEQELRKTIDYVKKLGYRISLHTNLLDSYEIADCFKWDNVCVRQDGTYLQRGDYSGGYSYIVCPKKQYENNRMHMAQLKDLGLNGVHFTDVISIVQPDVCHSDDHPCNTAEGIEISQKIMRETRETLGAFSSEGAYDFAVGELDYALYVCFGDGFGATDIPICDAFIPFYELTYHGIILYNPMSPTVNYTIKNARDRLLFFMRGGRPSFYIYSRFRANGKDWMGLVDLTCDSNESLEKTAKAIAKGEREYKDLADRQFIYMKDYTVLENGIEVAEYEDGVKFVANFSETDGEFEGKAVPAGDYVILNK